MALRKFMEKLTKPVDELDRDKLRDWCATQDAVPLDAVDLRQPVRLAGEVRSVRIVPRAGADAVEATISDGRGYVTAVFLGRRKIAGISPGRRIRLEGVVSRSDGAQLVFNPVYTLV